MGQTLTIETDGKNSLAATEAHKGVADDIADSDKAMVADVFNEICWLYTRLNAEESVFAPLFSYEEPEDLLSKADLDLKLKSMGVKWLRAHFENDYGLKPEEFELEGEGDPIAAPSSSEAPKPDAAEDEEPEEPDEGKADFAAPSGRTLAEDAQERLDAALAKHLPEALKANRNFINRLENIVNDAATFEELELELATLLSGEVESSEFEELMAHCMSGVAGYGAAAVNAEAEADDADA